MSGLKDPTPFRIFINYRRADAGSTAFRLADALERHLSPGQVFVDRKGLKGGDQWKQKLRAEVDNCQVMLVLIGKKWLSVRDPVTEKRRVDQEDDWVRNEIEWMRAAEEPAGLPAAQQRTIIPVLLNGARMPNSDQIALKSLLFLPDLQCMQVRWRLWSREPWNSDVNNLVKLLSELGASQNPLPGPVSSHPLPARLVAVIVVSVLLTGGGYVGWTHWQKLFALSSCPSEEARRDYDNAKLLHEHYFNDDKRREAVKMCKSALRICPSFPEACNLLKVLRKELGEPENCELGGQP